MKRTERAHMRTWLALRFGLALLALGSGACAPGRLADLRDAVHVGVGSGKGLAVDATLGFVSQPSIGLYGAKTVLFGSTGRDEDGFIAQSTTTAPYSFLYARREGASWLESLNFSGLRGSYSVLALQRGFEEVDKPLRPQPPREFGMVIDGRRFGGRVYGGRWLPLPSAADRFSPWLRFNTLTDFQVGAHVAIFAARAGVNPLELADFLLGFAGFDIAGDDVRERDDAYSAFAARSGVPYDERAFSSRARR